MANGIDVLRGCGDALLRRACELPLVTLLAAVHPAALACDALAGAWDWEAAPESRTFSLDLACQGMEVVGQYCAVARRGARIDCAPAEGPNIDGYVLPGETGATVRFSSFFDARDGLAAISRTADGLAWHVLKAPDGGEFHAPDYAVLRKRSIPHESGDDTQ